MKSFKQNIKMIPAAISILTWCAAPIAQAKESETALKEKQLQIAEYIKSTGYNAKMTVYDFVKQNQDNLPNEVRSRLLQITSEKPKEKMPEFFVKVKQNSLGEKVIFFETTSPSGKTKSYEYVGEEDVFFKDGKKAYSIYDVMGVESFIGQRNNTTQSTTKAPFPIKTKTVTKEAQSKLPTSVPNTYSLPVITPEIWSQLSRRERAEYIVRITMLDKAAVEVLMLAKKAGIKIPEPDQSSVSQPSDEKFAVNHSGANLWGGEQATQLNMLNFAQAKLSAWNFLLNSMVGEVRADSKDIVLDVGVGSAVTVAPNSGGSGKNKIECIVAGNVSVYDPKTGRCISPPSYSELTSKAKSLCKKQDAIPCNVNLFGAPNGNVICVDSKDNNEILRASSVVCMPNATAPNSQLDEIRVKCVGVAKCISEKKINLDVDQYLNGLNELNKKLKINNANLEFMIDSERKKFDPAFFISIGAEGRKEIKLSHLEELLKIQNQFNSDLEAAKKVCSNPKNQLKNESNFKETCQNISLLNLDLAGFLQEKIGCIGLNGKKDNNIKIDPTTLKCMCKKEEESTPKCVHTDKSKCWPTSPSVPAATSTPQNQYDPSLPLCHYLINNANDCYKAKYDWNDVDQICTKLARDWKPCNSVLPPTQSQSTLPANTTESINYVLPGQSCEKPQQVVVVGRRPEPAKVDCNEILNRDYSDYQNGEPPTLPQECQNMCEDGNTPTLKKIYGKYSYSCGYEDPSSTEPKKCESTFKNYTKEEAEKCVCDNGEHPYEVTHSSANQLAGQPYPKTHYACNNLDWSKIGIGALSAGLGWCFLSKKCSKSKKSKKAKCSDGTEPVNGSCSSGTVTRVCPTGIVLPITTPCPSEGGTGTNDTDNGGLPTGTTSSSQ